MPHFKHIMGQVACGKKNLPPGPHEDIPGGKGSYNNSADDAFFRQMAGDGYDSAGSQSSSSRPSDRLMENRQEIENRQDSGGKGKGQGKGKNGSGPPEKKVYSDAARAHAARLGVLLPGDDDDEEYGVLDEYMDDLLGTPMKDRPQEWQQPSKDQTGAALPAATPNIIFADGRKGPLEDTAQRKKLMISENPQESGAGTNNILGEVIGGWASIDKAVVEPQAAAAPSVVMKTGPSPKRKANPR